VVALKDRKKRIDWHSSRLRFSGIRAARWRAEVRGVAKIICSTASPRPSARRNRAIQRL
jgi:hypothetical protein